MSKMKSKPMKVNSFLDLNGIPYLLSEYIDKRNFQTMDRSAVRSEIYVDRSESMRAIVDISIDDIGRKSNGILNITGNSSKQKKLLRMISECADRLDHQLDVLKPGILLRVNYQLENLRTHQVIRSIVEELRVQNRNYFIDINSHDIDDNGVIVNFSNSIVSTMDAFTHGSDQMVLRITNIQMFYECLKRSPKMPRIKDSLYSQESKTPTTQFMDPSDYYSYHDKMQHHHVIGVPGDNDYPSNPHEIMSPTWSMFNRFYRFDNGGKDIILHSQEIFDPMNKVILIPCGTINVNRAFMINPGHRIIFKLSIWKNDVTIIGDTTYVAKALNAPIMDYAKYRNPDRVIDPDYESLIRLYRQSMRENERQTMVINQLVNAVNKLTADAISNNGNNPGVPPYVPPSNVQPTIPGDEDTVDDTDIDVEHPKCTCSCHQTPPPPPPPPPPFIMPIMPPPGKEMKVINKKLNDIQDSLDLITEEGLCDCPELVPFDNDVIDRICDSIDWDDIE